MSELHFSARFTWMGKETGAPLKESDFVGREKPVEIQLEASALILVDVWDLREVLDRYGWAPAFPPEIMERFDTINRERIRPVLDAARRIGMQVIHSPSAFVAGRRPEWQRLNEEMAAAEIPPSPPPLPRRWPPQGPAQASRDALFASVFGDEGKEVFEYRLATCGINPVVEPVEGEHVISDGRDLDYVCEKHRIVNLLYAGYCTNLCMFLNSGAIRDSANRGYRCFILRDCTTAQEYGESAKDLILTALTLAMIESCWAMSLTSTGFIDACDRLP